MEYFLLIVTIILVLYTNFYFFNREIRYYDFYLEVEKLCANYNSWQLRKGIDYMSDEFNNAYDFCRSHYKIPHEIPLSLMWSFKPINLNSMLTPEMKEKFKEYLLDDK